MNCTFNRELLSRYIDGELENAQAADVASHLSECAECRQILSHLQLLAERLDSIPIERAPAGLINQILSNTGARARILGWKASYWTLNVVWKAVLNGFQIDELTGEDIRTNIPTWVARWVMFV